MDFNELKGAYDTLYKESLKIKKKYVNLRSKNEVTSRELIKLLFVASESTNQWNLCLKR